MNDQEPPATSAQEPDRYEKLRRAQIETLTQRQLQEVAQNQQSSTIIPTYPPYTYETTTTYEPPPKPTRFRFFKELYELCGVGLIVYLSTLIGLSIILIVFGFILGD